MTTVKIDGLDKVLTKLSTIEQFYQWAHKPMTTSLSLLHDDIAKYKPKAKGAFSAMATAGQKRAYWARVRKGEITHRPDVGYVRSVKMGRLWTTKIDNTINKVSGEVGNVTKYVKYVQSAEKQQPFHKATGFATDAEVMEKNKHSIIALFQQAIRETIDS